MAVDVLRDFAAKYPLDLQKAVIVGVSGGADSLALLDLCQRAGWPVVAAHFNHRLRPEADVDARWLEELAASRGIPFVAAAADVARLAAVRRQSLEEAGREERYRFLFATAEKWRAGAVLVAHHADDQVETVLMHLLRGAGPSGLRGMRPFQLPNPWSDTIPLGRPLLSLWRDEILAYCRERGLRYLEDASNQDVTFFRNRLRHKLLPMMESYSPRVRQRLWRMAAVLAAEDDVMAEIAADAWEASLMDGGRGYRVFDLRAMQAQPLAVQRRLIRRAVRELRPTARDLDFLAVERALAVLRGEQSAAELALGVRALCEGTGFCLTTWETDLPEAQWPLLPTEETMLRLSIPGALQLRDGWQLSAALLEDGASAWEQARGNADPYRAWVDLGEDVPSELVVRSRRPGERFVPLGMDSGAIKVSDFMINVKLPRRARRRWPLVCYGDQVVWLPGYRLSHPFRLRRDSRRAVALILERTG